MYFDDRSVRSGIDIEIVSIDELDVSRPVGKTELHIFAYRVGRASNDGIRKRSIRKFLPRRIFIFGFVFGFYAAEFFIDGKSRRYRTVYFIAVCRHNHAYVRRFGIFYKDCVFRNFFARIVRCGDGEEKRSVRESFYVECFFKAAVERSR